MLTIMMIVKILIIAIDVNNNFPCQAVAKQSWQLLHFEIIASTTFVAELRIHARAKCARGRSPIAK